MKRTKKQKIKASNRRVNTQLEYKFDQTYNQTAKSKNAKSTDNFDYLGSTKKELFKSLFVAILIIISLVVIYWVSK